MNLLLQNKNADKNISIAVSAAEQLARLYSIPQVKEQKYIIEKVQTKDFWDEATILDLEGVREALRDLLQFIEKRKQPPFYTDFTDNIISQKEESLYISKMI